MSSRQWRLLIGGSREGEGAQGLEGRWRRSRVELRVPLIGAEWGMSGEDLERAPMAGDSGHAREPGRIKTGGEEWSEACSMAQLGTRGRLSGHAVHGGEAR